MKVCQDVINKPLHVQNTTGPKVCLQKARVATGKCLDSAVNYCVKLEEEVCLGHTLDNREIYLSLSSVSKLMNIFRQINSRFLMKWMGDAPFNMCVDNAWPT